MAKTHLMIDLQTLGTMPNATVLTIGAVLFDPYSESGVISDYDALYLKVDTAGQSELGLTIDASAVEWWATQGIDAENEVFGENDRLPLAQAMEQLKKFTTGAKTVWSNGASFDVVICENLFKTVEISCPWGFWQVRCARTLFNLGIDPKLPPATSYNSLEVAVSQAAGIQNVLKIIKQR